MTTQGKIAEIIDKRYRNYRGRVWIKLQVYHGLLRAKMTDEQFLEMLEECERKNQKPELDLSEYAKYTQ